MKKITRIFCGILFSVSVLLNGLPITLNAENTEELYYESYAADENGNIYEIQPVLLDRVQNVDTEEYSVSYLYEFSFPDQLVNIQLPSGESVNSSSSDTGYDSHGQLRVVLTIFYLTSGNGYLLTKVTGNWTFFDTGTSITDKELCFGCVGSSYSSMQQRRTVTPGTPFTYSTGFTEYVNNEAGSALGAVISFTLYNGSTWDFVLRNNLFANGADIGGRGF